jgi:hypothetical protein
MTVARKYNVVSGGAADMTLNVGGSITLVGGTVSGPLSDPIECPWDSESGDEIFSWDAVDGMAAWNLCYSNDISATWTPVTTAARNRGLAETEAVADTTTRPGYLLVQAQTNPAKTPTIYTSSLGAFDGTGDWTLVAKGSFHTPVEVNSTGLYWAISMSTANGNYLREEAVQFYPCIMDATNGIAARGIHYDAHVGTTDFTLGTRADRPYGSDSVLAVMTHVSGAATIQCHISLGSGRTMNSFGDSTWQISKASTDWTHLAISWNTSSADENYLYWLKYARLYQSIKTR